MVKEKLGPILGESKLVLAPEQNVDKALRKFIDEKLNSMELR